MSEKQERIVCAAVKRIGKDFLERDLECIDLCLQYDDEHSAVNYNSLLDVGVDFYSETQGFITNKNRFVDPVEARKIAAHAGQASWFYERLLDETPDQRLKPLKPEDLY